MQEFSVHLQAIMMATFNRSMLIYDLTTHLTNLEKLLDNDERIVKEKEELKGKVKLME